MNFDMVKFLKSVAIIFGFITGLLLLIFLIWGLVGWKASDNTLTIGDGALSANKTICVDQGNARGSRPCFRYNSTLSAWEFSDNGNDYTAINSLGGGTVQVISSANHTITEGGTYAIDANSNDVTVTLPSHTSILQQIVKLVRIDSSDNEVQLQTSSNQTIREANSTIHLWDKGAYITLRAHGTEWQVLDEDTKFYINLGVGEFASDPHGVDVLVGYLGFTTIAQIFMTACAGCQKTIVNKSISIGNVICRSNDRSPSTIRYFTSFSGNLIVNSNSCSNINRLYYGFSIPSLEISGNYLICSQGQFSTGTTADGKVQWLFSIYSETDVFIQTVNLLDQVVHSHASNNEGQTINICSRINLTNRNSGLYFYLTNIQSTVLAGALGASTNPTVYLSLIKL